jgi:hypothetical protein
LREVIRRGINHSGSSPKKLVVMVIEGFKGSGVKGSSEMIKNYRK